MADGIPRLVMHVLRLLKNSKFYVFGKSFGDLVRMADPKMMAGQTRSNLAHRPMLSKSLVYPLIEEEIERYQGNHRISSDFDQASGTLCKFVVHEDLFGMILRFSPNQGI